MLQEWGHHDGHMAHGTQTGGQNLCCSVISSITFSTDVSQSPRDLQQSPMAGQQPIGDINIIRLSQSGFARFLIVTCVGFCWVKSGFVSRPLNKEGLSVKKEGLLPFLDKFFWDMHERMALDQLETVWSYNGGCACWGNLVGGICCVNRWKCDTTRSVTPPRVSP
jgi:hypothetical protein